MKRILFVFLAFLALAGPAGAQVLQPGTGGGGSFDVGADFAPTGTWIFTIPPCFEGATANDFETCFAVTDPTADRTVTIQDASGTVAYGDQGAGAPANGSCPSNIFFYSDSTNDELYFCSDGAGGNPRLVPGLRNGPGQVTGDTGSATFSGSDTLRFIGGTGIATVCADGAPDNCTFNIDNHVKSVYFGAGALFGDGTQCPASPSIVTINSGAPRLTFICADNDASTLYGEAQMPDSWDGGTVTLMGSFIQTAADTANLNADVAMSCRGDGTTINNTWGTEIAMDTAMAGSSAIDNATTAAVTPNGTCTGGGKLLQFRWQMDATGTTTAVATLHVVGFKLEYTVTGAGSD